MTTILICDDEDALRGLVRDSLAGEEYTFLEARDGDEAVELARRHQPDVILLDLMMPGRSGLEALRELRADKGLVDTPIVVLTARAQVTDRDEAEAAGATLFVTKPFSPFQLAATVADLLKSGQ